MNRLHAGILDEAGDGGSQDDGENDVVERDHYSGERAPHNLSHQYLVAGSRFYTSAVAGAVKAQQWTTCARLPPGALAGPAPRYDRAPDRRERDTVPCLRHRPLLRRWQTRCAYLACQPIRIVAHRKTVELGPPPARRWSRRHRIWLLRGNWRIRHGRRQLDSSRMSACCCRRCGFSGRCHWPGRFDRRFCRRRLGSRRCLPCCVRIRGTIEHML